jgi:hypothetical protein
MPVVTTTVAGGYEINFERTIEITANGNRELSMERTTERTTESCGQ